jgi:hypothetical protein
MVLFGGGYVAERNANGKVIGYTGTWAYDFRKKDWLPVQTEWQPPPRMNTRLVCDTRNQVLVLFGGDAQSEYLADTWLYDLQARKWRQSKAAVGPEARAGHFTAYDPQTGWVIIGGGYNREDLTDMWAYDTAKDHWVRLAGQVPAGFYVTGDIAPEKRLILLVTSNRTTDDKMTCNILYPVRTTYAYRIDEKTVIHPDPSMRAQQAMPKRPPEDSLCGTEPDAARQKAQAERLATMPVNQWVYLAHPGRVAPDRTWGSATFDTDRGRILYWGGEHCGYEGSDVDAYDVTLHTWLGSPSPEYPDRMWDHGYSRNLSMGLTGVTFRGDPWTIHARRIYSYDLVSGKMIMVRPVRLTMGYNPESLLQFPGEARAYVDALVKPPGSYDKWVTWAFDLVTRQWHVAGPAPVGLDTLVTTRHGVIGVTVDWPARTNDAGYLLPWSPSLPPKDTAVYLFRWLSKRWTRLGKPQPSPQNLWEMTSLVYDSTRDRVILHGGGKKRNELWTFDLRTHRWEKLKSTVEGGAEPPECSREAVYLPHEDVVLIFGPAPQDRSQFQLWAYKVSESTWHQIDIPAPAAADSAWEFSQNRAMVYDPNRDLVFLVLGTGGDRGKAFVFALKYRHDQARFVATRAAR